MLIELLEILRRNHGGVTVSEISRRLGTEAGVVSGMLQVLIDKCRVVEIGPDGLVCSTCPLKSGCNLLTGRNSRYVLEEKVAPVYSFHSEPISACGPSCRCGRSRDE